MDDAELVRGFERIGNLSSDRDRLVDGKRAVGESVGEGAALHQFEHQRLSAAGFFEPVDGARYGDG